MKISVKVKPRSRQNKVERVSDKEFKVWVSAAADKGKANEAVIEALSTYFERPKSRFEIVNGMTSSNKIIEVM